MVMASYFSSACIESIALAYPKIRTCEGLKDTSSDVSTDVEPEGEQVGAAAINFGQEQLAVVEWQRVKHR